MASDDDRTPELLALQEAYDRLWVIQRAASADPELLALLKALVRRADEERVARLDREGLTPEQLARQEGYARSWLAAQHAQTDPEMMVLIRERMRQIDDEPKGPPLTREELLRQLGHPRDHGRPRPLTDL